MSNHEHPNLVQISGRVPLDRASEADLQAEVRTVAASPIVRAVLEAVDGGVLVLNAHRQIVAANLRGLLQHAQPSLPELIGLRPGEALSCSFASLTSAGCGGSEGCRSCGALKAILGCQGDGSSVESDCLLPLGPDPTHALELRVKTSRIEVGSQPFTVLALRDASDENRRKTLEQVFFHDLLNSITGLSNWAQMLLRVPPERLRSTTERVVTLTERLAKEVGAHRAVLEAERGILRLDLAPVSTREAIREVVAIASEHPLARRRAVLLGEHADVAVETDSALLARVLTNMVTNALEATPEDGAVRVWTEPARPGTPWACTFHVHNHTVMPREVAARVFQRSFSTKAKKGRGLGTYSMKLLGERHLGGQVTFVSRPDEGTIFSFSVPPRPPA